MFIAKANLGLLADSHSSPQSLGVRKIKEGKWNELPL